MKRELDSLNMIDVKIGDRVYLLKPGTDKVEYAAVLWVGNLPPEHVGPNVGPFAGIQFDNPVGKGNGSLGNTQYFYAREGFAAFVPTSMLHKVHADANSLFSASYSPPSVSSNQYYRRHIANNIDDSRNPVALNQYHLNGIAPSINGSGEIGDGPMGSRSAYAPIGTRPAGNIVGNSYGAFNGLSSSPYANGHSSSPYVGEASPAKAAPKGANIGANYPSAGKIHLQSKSEEEEFFESDDEIDEALKVDGEISALTNMMIQMTTPSSSSGDVKAATPDMKAASPEKTSKTQNNNNIGASAASAAARRAPSPPSEAPSSSQEWSVVASKIKKAPKQVRDQLKAPEKKTTPVKTKTKMEKLIAENPKYKSTLCNWYMQGARCPNGNECHFAHGESEMRVMARPMFKYKTQVCSYYAAGHCGNGSTCHFAHGLADLHK